MSNNLNIEQSSIYNEKIKKKINKIDFSKESLPIRKAINKKKIDDSSDDEPVNKLGKVQVDESIKKIIIKPIIRNFNETNESRVFKLIKNKAPEIEEKKLEENNIKPLVLLPITKEIELPKKNITYVDTSDFLKKLITIPNINEKNIINSKPATLNPIIIEREVLSKEKVLYTSKLSMHSRIIDKKDKELIYNKNKKDKSNFSINDTLDFSIKDKFKPKISNKTLVKIEKLKDNSPILNNNKPENSIKINNKSSKDNFKPKKSNKDENKLDKTTLQNKDNIKPKTSNEKPTKAKSISTLHSKDNIKLKTSNEKDKKNFEKPKKAKSISKLYMKNNFKPKKFNKNKLDETTFEKPIEAKSISKINIKNNFKPKISNKNK